MGSYMIDCIEYFEPDNDENTLYVKCGYNSWSIQEVLQLIQEHFNVNQESAILDFEITAEYIHTDCIGYDSYDPGDYTNYLCITRK